MVFFLLLFTPIVMAISRENRAIILRLDVAGEPRIDNINVKVFRNNTRIIHETTGSDGVIPIDVIGFSSNDIIQVQVVTDKYTDLRKDKE